MAEQTQEQEKDDTDLLPTKELTVEQARLRYQDEETRRAAVEGKIGTIITVDALIISIGGIFTDRDIFILAAMVLGLISVGIGLWALRARDYNRPGKAIDDFLQYEDIPVEQQRKDILFDYIVTLDGNEDAEDPEERKIGNKKKNDRKYLYFDICVLLTGVALALILVQPTIELLQFIGVL